MGLKSSVIPNIYMKNGATFVTQPNLTDRKPLQDTVLTCMPSKLTAYTYIPLTGFQVVNRTDVV